MDMNRKMKTWLPLGALVAAALVAGCSADQIEAEAGGDAGRHTGETVAGATVNFANNTALTVGGARPAAALAPVAVAGGANAACLLDMEQSPDGSVVDAIGSIDADMTLSGVTAPVVIGRGATCAINISGCNVSSVIYVRGTLNINGTCTGGGKVVVLEGGTLNYNAGTLGGISIVNHGTLAIGTASLGVASGSELLTVGDISLGGELTVAGRVFVGGTLSCASAAVEGGGQLRLAGTGSLGGTLRASGQAAVCAEGRLVAGTLEATGGASVHIACGLEATNEINTGVSITNGATVCAAYIKSGALHVSGGERGSRATLCLPDGGVAQLGRLTVGANASVCAYAGGQALVDAGAITVENRTLWEDVFGSGLYVNYSSLSADAAPADASLVNVAKANEPQGGGCSPGFTVDGGAGEGGAPAAGDIVLEIPAEVLQGREYIVGADDFAIRADGKYLDGLTVDAQGGTASLGGIRITGQGLFVTVSGIENLEAGTDYTYEVWIWIDNAMEAERPDGSGQTEWVELFDEAMKEEWTGGADGADGDPYGTDVSARIRPGEGVVSPAGYSVRYNVYRGIAGRAPEQGGQAAAVALGDTPYVKVSIHVQKCDGAPANTAVPVCPQQAGE